MDDFCCLAGGCGVVTYPENCTLTPLNLSSVVNNKRGGGKEERKEGGKEREEREGEREGVFCYSLTPGDCI